jgi:hypothetical protein
MSGIQRPFPGLATAVPAPPPSVISQLTNSNPLAIANSSSAYLSNYSTMNNNPTVSNVFLDDQSNINRHFSNLDANIASFDLGAPAQFQTVGNATNSFYASQRTHTSPSATSAYPATFAYPTAGFNHHHHLTSNVDDGSFLIQNPSLT